MPQIGKKIKSVREAARVMQTELARRVGCSSQLISAFETGRIKPTKDQLEKIALSLDLQPDYFSGKKVRLIQSKLDLIKTELAEVQRLLAEVQEVEGEE